MKPSLTKPVANHQIINLRYGRLKQITRKMFPQLSETALEELQSKYKWLPLERSQLLCRQGEAGDSLYILVTGRLKAVVDAATQNLTNLPELLLLGGGYPIWHKGQVIGGIGVAGGGGPENDDTIAKAVTIENAAILIH